MSQKNKPEPGTEEKRIVSPPFISLPKGGSAIRGIGEKLAANPVIGTGSLSILIATYPGCSGFTPELFLAYGSLEGNSPFGFSWSHSLLSITRKTDRGLPQQNDAEEFDVFLLLGQSMGTPTENKHLRGVNNPLPISGSRPSRHEIQVDDMSNEIRG